MERGEEDMHPGYTGGEEHAHAHAEDRERDPLNLRSARLSREELEELERTGFKLFLGNLSYDTKVQDIEREFSKYGEIRDVFLPMHRVTGTCRGFGFVTFADRKAAEDAEKNLNGVNLLGRDIAVNFARPRPSGAMRRGSRFGGRPYPSYPPRRPYGGYGGDYYDRGYDAPAYDDRRYDSGYYGGGYGRRERPAPYERRAPPPPSSAPDAYDQRAGGYYSGYSGYQAPYDDRAYRQSYHDAR
eukprot:m.167359 g.167359  ORF g.167359 m.167359 type:complete len:242 (-) comp16452_c5_seq1:145-870(-)